MLNLSNFCWHFSFLLSTIQPPHPITVVLVVLFWFFSLISILPGFEERVGKRAYVQSGMYNETSCFSYVLLLHFQHPPGQWSASKMVEKHLLCAKCSEAATALNSSYFQIVFFFDSFLIIFLWRYWRVTLTDTVLLCTREGSSIPRLDRDEERPHRILAS